jgi:CheY-like chemotaxis protein
MNTKQAPVSTKIDHADLSGKVILVVEDEIYNYKMIENALRKTKAQVVNARTGIQALEYHKRYQPHIILMDIKIPELPGTEVMKKIREYDEHTPIIAQTAFAMQNEEITLKSSGFDDYIAKPFKAEDIIALIQKYL